MVLLFKKDINRCSYAIKLNNSSGAEESRTFRVIDCVIVL